MSTIVGKGGCVQHHVSKTRISLLNSAFTFL